MTAENENIRKDETAESEAEQKQEKPDSAEPQKQDEKKNGEWKLDMDNEVKTGKRIMPKAVRNLVIMIAVLAAVAVIFDMCR